MANHCTLFPDKLRLELKKLRLAYDIGFFCLIHDEYYELQVIPRKVADLVLFAMCTKAYPEYPKLWHAVYRAVRVAGWAPWYWCWLRNKVSLVTLRFKQGVKRCDS